MFTVNNGATVKKYINSIVTFLVVVIFFSFFIPLSVGVLYELSDDRIRIESEIDSFQDNLLHYLERELLDAVVNFEPKQVENVLGVALQDDRIHKIKVFSTVYKMTLADLSKASKNDRGYFP
ncbi:MAG: hypothetical protein ACK5JO_00050, partial [Halodesulfovibrio sp.]